MTGMTRKRRVSLLAAWAGALLVACSPQAAESPSASASLGVPDTARVHRVSGLEIIPVTITRADGTAHVIAAEYAVEQIDQARGLMFRSEMGADEGMLFDYEDAPHSLSFWMRNTVIPLDLIFIDPERRVLNIAANAQPYSEDRILSAGVASAVLEVNGGRASELGIAPGDKVAW